MGTLLENLDAAKELDLPICQDTGMAVIFAMWVRTCILSAVILKMP